jgi:hypothetical protein
MGRPVVPPYEIVAHLLGKLFHKLPSEILREPADEMILAWTLEQDLTPKER